MKDKYPVVVGHSEGKISNHRFMTVKAAEEFIKQLERVDPEGVHAGEYYIDAPEEIVNADYNADYKDKRIAELEAKVAELQKQIDDHEFIIGNRFDE